MFIRCDAALIAALDAEVDRRARRGVVLSRSDVVRSILWESLTGETK
jgi:hypothetical protein